MRIEGYNFINSVSSAGKSSSPQPVPIKSNNTDTVSISAAGMKSSEDNKYKTKLSDEFEDMRIYTADYNTALKMIDEMVIEKQDAVDLASCGEYFLMMYHKVSIDTGLTEPERTKLQNKLEDGYVNFMELRGQKEGWGAETEQSISATRGLIQSMGSEEYYNDYLTLVLGAVLKGDYQSAYNMRKDWDNRAATEQQNQMSEEEYIRRQKELAQAQILQRRLDMAINIAPQKQKI